MSNLDKNKMLNAFILGFMKYNVCFKIYFFCVGPIREDINRK